MDGQDNPQDAQARLRLNRGLMEAHQERLVQVGFDKEEIERLIALRARLLNGRVAWG